MSETTISVDELTAWLAQGRPVTVLDVRPDSERAEWSVPGSMHVALYDELKAGRTQGLSRLALPTDRPVVTVCGAGKTSLVAATYLRGQGLDARSLAGGMRAWSLAWNQACLSLPSSQAQIIQVRRTGKGCLSYIVGSGGIAAVVDASLAPEVYLELAQAQGWRIAQVLETHVHADHWSRGRSLAEQSGATLYLPDGAPVTYPHAVLYDGDELTLGASYLRVLHTPGHTLESACYLLNGQALFTGDTLFAGAVGRPDLEASIEQARQRAYLLYGSLARLLALPPETLILPGHTSEPVAFDGRALTTTLAAARAEIALLHLSEGEFVEALLQRVPAAPPNHQIIVELNRTGALPAGDLSELEAGANRCAVA
jgi:glyoxylase-like metal-dependent hydrolase (beta-lactamase superfamily II)